MKTKPPLTLILATMCLSLLLTFPLVSMAAEIDKGLVIIDKDPWKVSWVQEQDAWILYAYFEKGILKTYFKQPPPAKSFGLSVENRPTKQEFEYFFGKTITANDCQFEQWPDGARCYAFTYDYTFEEKGKKFQFGTTAIIEEVADNPNEIRYAIYKQFH